MRATSERFLPARATFRSVLASDTEATPKTPAAPVTKNKPYVLSENTGLGFQLAGATGVAGRRG